MARFASIAIAALVLSLSAASKSARAADATWFGLDLGYGNTSGTLNIDGTYVIPFHMRFQWRSDRWAAGVGLSYNHFTGGITPPMRSIMAETMFTRLLGDPVNDVILPHFSFILGVGQVTIDPLTAITMAAGADFGIFVNGGSILWGTGIRIDDYLFQNAANFTGMTMSWNIIKMRVVLGKTTAPTVKVTKPRDLPPPEAPAEP